MHMSMTIGVDVGGTKIAAGLVRDGQIIASLRKPTPAHDADAVVQTIVDCITELPQSDSVARVGIGAAGFVTADRREVVFSPNLPWRNFPLAQRVEDATGKRVVVENDANAAAWAEYRFGVAVGAQSVAVVTVGTGIGGGIIIDGQLIRGASGFAAEIGHICLEPTGHRCNCGLTGCWEAYSSGSALVRDARQVTHENPTYAARLLELAGGSAEAVTGHMVTQAAQEGDPCALACFNNIGHWMGYGLADLAAVLDPEVFVLAGGVCEAGDLLLTPTRESFEKLLTARAYRRTPQIMIATLGPSAGVIGAADLGTR